MRVLACCAVATLLLSTSGAFAQAGPSGGAGTPVYQPIPNFTGTNAGQQFRNAINNRLGGAQGIAPMILPSSIMQSATAGQFLLAGTSGAISPITLNGDVGASTSTLGAITVNHFSLTSSASAGGFRVTTLAAPLNSGDAVSLGSSGAVNGGSQPVNIQGNQTNGADAMTGVCVNGICPGSAFGMSAADLDDSAKLAAAVTAAYETGTGSATKGKIVLGPDKTGGTTYKFTSGVDLKEVPLECAGPSAANSAGLFNITLDFTGMASGAALKNVGWIRGCRLIGAFAVGSGRQATITAISEAGENTVSVTTGAATTIVSGTPITVSGTTNYNGAWVVANTTDATHFTFQIARSNLGPEAAGNIDYYPTEGVVAHNPGNSPELSCCSVDWENMYVKGFGAAFDLSATQTAAGSTNNWHLRGLNADTAIVGFQALGNYRQVPVDDGNVAAGNTSALMKCSSTSICFNAGPAATTGNAGTALNDPKENGFGNNDIAGFDFEIADTNSADSFYVAGFWGGAYGNSIHDNFMSAGGSAGAGQTAEGAINTSAGEGNNLIVNDHLGNANVLSSSDHVANLVSGAGQSLSSAEGTSFQSGLKTNPVGTTPDPYYYKMVVNNVTCAPGSAGCNCAPHSYGLVAHDFSYSGTGEADGTALASAHFICPDGSLVSSGVSCPANTGLCTYNNTTSFATVCWPRNHNIKSYDVLLDNTAQSVAGNGLNFLAGSNGNNCFPDTRGTAVAYTAPGVDSTGGININNPTAVIRIGATTMPSSGRSILFGSTGLTTLATTNAAITYMSVATATASTAESQVETTFAVSGTVSRLHCNVATAPGTSNSYKFTVRHVFSADLTGSCTISGSNTGCSDNVDSDAVSEGSATGGNPFYDIEVLTTVAGTAPIGTIARCSAELTGF